MSFLKLEMSTFDVVEGVLPLLPPSVQQMERCASADRALRARGLETVDIVHELFLLKAAMASQFAMGTLETLGMRAEGIEQFYEIFCKRLEEGLSGVLRSDPKAAVLMARARLGSYDKALHTPHPEDRFLNVADAFTRFCGAADETELVHLCLDACQDLNRSFIAEIRGLGIVAEDKEP